MGVTGGVGWWVGGCMYVCVVCYDRQTFRQTNNKKANRPRNKNCQTDRQTEGMTPPLVGGLLDTFTSCALRPTHDEHQRSDTSDPLSVSMTVCQYDCLSV